MNNESPPKPPGALMTLAEAASALGLSAKRMSAAVASGQIKLYVLPIGDKTFVRRAELDRFMRGNPSAAEQIGE